VRDQDFVSSTAAFYLKFNTKPYSVIVYCFPTWVVRLIVGAQGYKEGGVARPRDSVQSTDCCAEKPFQGDIRPHCEIIPLKWLLAT